MEDRTPHTPGRKNWAILAQAWCSLLSGNSTSEKTGQWAQTWHACFLPKTSNHAGTHYRYQSYQGYLGRVDQRSACWDQPGTFIISVDDGQ